MTLAEVFHVLICLKEVFFWVECKHLGIGHFRGPCETTYLSFFACNSTTREDTEDFSMGRGWPCRKDSFGMSES